MVFLRKQRSVHFQDKSIFLFNFLVSSLFLRKLRDRGGVIKIKLKQILFDASFSASSLHTKHHKNNNIGLEKKIVFYF